MNLKLSFVIHRPRPTLQSQRANIMHERKLQRWLWEVSAFRVFCLEWVPQWIVILINYPILPCVRVNMIYSYIKSFAVDKLLAAAAPKP